MRSVPAPAAGLVKPGNGTDGPQFAIVIPIHRQPGLAVEAIAAALREVRQSAGVVVLVNDGCPFEATHAACLDFAEAYPDHVVYLRSGNGGLSAARNRGIRHALARFPGIGAIFLLDADNRLQPGAMRRALAVLHATGADWVYPDIDKFGDPFHADMSGPYSVLRHLRDNICDAGCLIHRRVFDAGLTFDESLRDGYEDWDFWLRCAAAGLRGAHGPDFGFQYRMRRDSMVAQADRQRAALLADLQRRHRALFAAAVVLRLEHQEAPRFCLIHDDRQQFHFTSAPGAGHGHAPLAELESAFWQAVCHSGRHHFPPFVVLLERPALLELQRLKLADWLFWQIETLLETHPTVSVQLVVGCRIACTRDPAEDIPPLLLATRFTHLRNLATDQPTATGSAGLRLEAPFRSVGGQPILAPLLAMLRQTAWRLQTDGGPDWRARLMTPWPELYRSVRASVGARGPLVRGGGDGREAGFLLPAGPVDGPLLDVAREMRGAGWRIRLIVEAPVLDDPAPLIDLFDVICLFDPAGGDRDGLLGLLAGCSAVLDGGSRAGLAVMGELRHRCVVTALTIARDGLAIADALAHEHALDLIAVASRRLHALCQASGLPADKLVRLDGRAGTLTQRLVRLVTTIG